MPSRAEQHRHRFELFVVGVGNRVAAGAALAVADAPGTGDNPLVIIGPPGSGKSHLLHAVGVEAQAQRRGLVVEAVSLADPAVLEQAGTEARWRAAHFLLVDDLQFAGQLSASAQQQLERTIDLLVQSHRQVVLAVDRPLAEISGLSARLLSRLAAGLSVELLSPDFDTRLRMLRAYCAGLGVEMAEVALEEIARFVVTDVRVLQGMLKRVIAVDRFRLQGEAQRRHVPTERPAREFEDLLAFADPEKIIWDWPDVSARLVEDAA